MLPCIMEIDVSVLILSEISELLILQNVMYLAHMTHKTHNLTTYVEEQKLTMFSTFYSVKNVPLQKVKNLPLMLTTAQLLQKTTLDLLSLLNPDILSEISENNLKPYNLMKEATIQVMENSDMPLNITSELIHSNMKQLMKEIQID
jgi:hypothetical protein